MQPDDALVIMRMMKVMANRDTQDVELLCTGCGSMVPLLQPGPWPTLEQLAGTAGVHGAQCTARPVFTDRESDVCPVHGGVMLPGHPGEWLCVCPLDGGSGA